MKFLPIRSVFCTLSLVLSVTASAKSYRGEESIVADFAAVSSKSYLSANASLDYAAKQIELSLQPVMPACKPGFMCAQVMPAPVSYVLNDAQSTIDSCNIIRTHAVIDQTPVDGVKFQVTITNNSGNTCPTLVALPALNLLVKKQWYNRLKGQWVNTSDRFKAEEFTLAEAPFVYEAVIRAELTASSSERYLSANLFVDGRVKTVELSLQPVMPACKPGFSCAQVMPEPVVYNLEDSTSEVDDCGIIRTVASFDHMPSDGIFFKVTINNNRNNTCPTFVALPAMEVMVEQKYYSRLDRKEIQNLDTFTAEDFAMIKPVTKK